MGLTPKAELVDYTFTGGDLYEELLLGPAYSIAEVLTKNNLTIDDIDVFEIHEAFAGQVLANLNALASAEWCKKQLGLEKPIGRNPFGATGGRLLTMAANRLQHGGGKYAILAACAAGAHGHAMLIKRYETTEQKVKSAAKNVIEKAEEKLEDLKEKIK